MTKQIINVQDGFLLQCLKSKLRVEIELVTGRTITGHLKRFDRFALLLGQGESEILVYKHAVATLVAAEQSD